MLKSAQSALWSFKSWDELGLHPLLIRNLKNIGLKRPTVVQERALLPIVNGTDTVVAAPTGSGKTLAYLLPLLNETYMIHDFIKQHKNHNTKNPLGDLRPWVVVAPSRDLCAQIAEMAMLLDPYGYLSVQSLVPFPDRHLVTATRKSAKEFSDTPYALNALDSRSLPGEPTSTNHPTGMFTPFDLSSSFANEKGNEGQRSVMWGRRIRWNSADLIVTTVDPLVKELERCSFENIFPSCVVLDEVDSLFQGNESRVDVFDLIKFLRPRLPIRQPNESVSPFSQKSSYDALKAKCQVVVSGATVPAMGHLSTGAMLVERFPTAAMIRHSLLHRLPSGVISRFVTVDVDKDNLTKDSANKSSKKDTLYSSSSSSSVKPFVSRGKTSSSKRFIVSLTSKSSKKVHETNELHSEHINKPFEFVEDHFEYKEAFQMRFNAFIDVMRHQPSERTLVFTNSQLECRRLYQKLIKLGWPVVSFHRGMGMTHRLEAMADFHSSKAVVCIATDLGARGIDFLEVDHVVNFSCPTDATIFIHRGGRVGRAGSENGVVTTFVSSRQEKMISELMKLSENNLSLQSTFSRKRSLNSKMRSRLRSTFGRLRSQAIETQLSDRIEALKEVLAAEKQLPSSGRASHTVSSSRRTKNNQDKNYNAEHASSSSTHLTDKSSSASLMNKLRVELPSVKARETLVRSGVILSNNEPNIEENKQTLLYSSDDNNDKLQHSDENFNREVKNRNHLEFDSKINVDKDQSSVSSGETNFTATAHVILPQEFFSDSDSDDDCIDEYKATYDMGNNKIVNKKLSFSSINVNIEEEKPTSYKEEIRNSDAQLHEIPHLRQIGKAEYSVHQFINVRSAYHSNSSNNKFAFNRDLAEVRQDLLTKYAQDSSSAIAQSRDIKENNSKLDWDALRRSPKNEHAKETRKGTSRTRTTKDIDVDLPISRTTSQKLKGGKYGTQNGALSNFSDFDDNIKL